MENRYIKSRYYKKILTEDGIAIIDHIKIMPSDNRVTILLKQTIELLDRGNISAVLDLYADKEGLMSDFTCEEIFIFKTVFFNTKLDCLPQYPNFECPYVLFYGTCLPWIITELKNNIDIDLASIDLLIANDKAMIKNRDISIFYQAKFFYDVGIVVTDHIKTIPNDNPATLMLKQAIELWESENISTFLDLYIDKKGLRTGFTTEERFLFIGTLFHTNVLSLPQYPNFNPFYTPHGTCLSWIIEEIEINTDIGLLKNC
ncbi:MAG: hypothetical protein FWG64_03690 [Firmicutes bacterium]|nr:hypothetical protein [Bacillota bacterium]